MNEMEYYGCKLTGEGRWGRKTKEVEITVILRGGKILIYGEGDLRHHLLEDTIILLQKIVNNERS